MKMMFKGISVMFSFSFFPPSSILSFLNLVKLTQSDTHTHTHMHTHTFDQADMMMILVTTTTITITTNIIIIVDDDNYSNLGKLHFLMLSRLGKQYIYIERMMSPISYIHLLCILFQSV